MHGKQQTLTELARQHILRAGAAAALLLAALTPIAYAAPLRFGVTLECTGGQTGSASVQAVHLSGGALVPDGSPITLSCTPGTTSTTTVQPKHAADRFEFQVSSPNAPGNQCGGVMLFSTISTTPITVANCNPSIFPNLVFQAK